MKRFQYPLFYLFISISILYGKMACGEEKEKLYNDIDRIEFSIAFSPDKSAKELVIDSIDNARKSILMAAYSFTSKDIALTLLKAHKRGLNVRIIVDKKSSQAKYSAVTFLSNQGVPVRCNGNYAIFHNKFMIIDGSNVETGSYNYSVAAAKKNAENILIVKNAPDVAKRYTEEWYRLWEESTPLKPKY